MRLVLLHIRLPTPEFDPVTVPEIFEDSHDIIHSGVHILVHCDMLNVANISAFYLKGDDLC